MPSNIYGGNILILYGIFILPSILISLIIIKPDLKNGILSPSEEIKNAIQGRSTKLIEKDKVILILVDSLGYSLAQKIGFQAERIHSVFPTITVITTLLTSQPPVTG
ncbi:MAG: hypothetical protein QXV57_09630 [Thermoproteota archaeon]